MKIYQSACSCCQVKGAVHDYNSLHFSLNCCQIPLDVHLVFVLQKTLVFMHSPGFVNGKQVARTEPRYSCCFMNLVVELKYQQAITRIVDWTFKCLWEAGSVLKNRSNCCCSCHVNVLFYVLCVTLQRRCSPQTTPCGGHLEASTWPTPNSTTPTSPSWSTPGMEKGSTHKQSWSPIPRYPLSQREK